MSTATTRPEGPISRANSIVKKPIPGPGSSTVIPSRTKGRTTFSGSNISRRSGLARKYPSHHGHTRCDKTTSMGANSTVPRQGYPLDCGFDDSAPTPPNVLRIPSRNRSRSSGVILSQRSIMRRRQCIPLGPPRNPPNRILLRITSPMACQKVTTFHPNSAGISQFHNDITISPNRAMNSTAIGKNLNALMNLFFLIFYPFSALLEFFVNGPQSAAQVQYRIALARQQRVYADARLLRHLLEAVAQQLVPDE